jgi:hypothetical protein
MSSRPAAGEGVCIGGGRRKAEWEKEGRAPGQNKLKRASSTAASRFGDLASHVNVWTIGA